MASHNYSRGFNYAPSRAPLSIVHEDNEILLIDKPSGLLSVPGKSEPDCLEARVKAYCSSALTVHRLDMATSGIMVFAKSANAQRHLGLQFEKRMTRKSYIARVWGHVQPVSGTVNLPLICDWPNRPLQMVDHERGKEAITKWEVITQETRSTRLLLSPQTGRSHQLRVHCLEMGHPILGDRLYAPDDAYQAAPRLQLHAQSLSIRHPDGGEWAEFTVKAPF